MSAKLGFLIKTLYCRIDVFEYLLADVEDDHSV